MCELYYILNACPPYRIIFALRLKLLKNVVKNFLNLHYTMETISVCRELINSLSTKEDFLLRFISAQKCIFEKMGETEADFLSQISDSVVRYR